MQYLKVWTSFRELLEPLTDAERGRLFVAMLEYAESGAEPQLSGSERYVWPSARQSINNTRDKSEQMKANGSRSRQIEANQSKPEQTEANQSKPEQTRANPSRPFDKEKDNDNDKRVLTHSQESSASASAEADRSFDAFWAAYPLHKAKARAYQEFTKISPDTRLLEVILLAIQRQKKWRHWRSGYIPTPANWLRERRWEDEEEPELLEARPTRQGSAADYSQREYDEEEMERRLAVDD